MNMEVSKLSEITGNCPCEKNYIEIMTINYRTNNNSKGKTDFQFLGAHPYVV